METATSLVPPAGQQQPYGVEGLFSREKLRGALTSVVGSSIVGSSFFFSTQVMGVNPIMGAILILYLFGGVLGYTLDILFAKASFNLRSYNGVSPYSGRVAYSDIGVRGLWLLESFVSVHFFRFLITVLIDVAVGVTLTRAVIAWCDASGVMPNNTRLRDALVAVGVGVLCFFVYGNVIRFDWAYRETNDPLANIIVMMWATLVLTVFASTLLGPLPKKGEKSTDENGRGYENDVRETEEDD